MFAAAFGVLLLWARNDRTRGPASATSTRAAELDARLAPALRELTTLRTDIIAQVKARSVMRVPLGTAAAWSPGPSRVAAMILRVCSSSDCS